MRRLVYTSVVICLLVSMVFVASVSAAPARADRGPWAPGMALVVNDTVTYAGCTYKVLQSHNTLAGWEPPTTPALFQQLSCGVATATRTRTATVGGPTATRTRTPTVGGPTATRTRTAVGPTATSGAGCWAAWVSTTAYNGGAQVSRNSQNYQAAYWTQGNDPATSSGPAGSGQPWITMGACGSEGPTATRTSTPVGPTATRTNTPVAPAATRTNTPIGRTDTQTAGGGTKILGYFAECGVYGRNYHVKN